jgi:hypothetical protein
MEPPPKTWLLNLVSGIIVSVTGYYLTEGWGDLKFRPSTNSPEESDTSPHWMNYRLLETELSQKSERELNLIRNEIFARHGYIFEDSEYRDYFNNKSWYSPKYTCKEFSDIYPLTDVQDYNADLIRRHQCERGHSSCDDNPPC